MDKSVTELTLEKMKEEWTAPFKERIDYLEQNNKEVFAAVEKHLLKLEQAISDAIEALERGSTATPVVECLRAALGR